jgi:Abnormal spindle-like microcephaly-assoc'd, ASPM-SPD-2-Hydin/Kelch motif
VVSFVLLDYHTLVQKPTKESVMASWKSLSGIPSFSPDTMLLMTDGSILIHDAYGADWYRLAPDSNGQYDTVGVSWSGPFAMANTRQFFGSGIVKDGRVYAVGGEYSSAGNDTPLGEIFDPLTNAWSPLSKPAAFSSVAGDAISCILQDGRVIFGSLSTSQTPIWDPAFDTWTEGGTAFGTSAPTKFDGSDEESWLLLPDGTVLTVTITSPPFAEKYVPETDTWMPASAPPQPLALLNLPDTTVHPPVSINIGEIGPALLLPDGRAFFVGATGHTALYTPPPAGSPSLPGAWAAAHDLPGDTSGANFNAPNGNLQTAIDAPAVLLPGGKVLLVGGNTVREVDGGNTEFWSNPSTVFLYDPAANTLTKLPSQPPSNGVDCWQARFLLLPTGQVLMTTQQSQKICILTDAGIIGAPLNAWKPTIKNFTPVMTLGHHYKISGTQLNGLSQANAYGDDAQMATNFPIAQFTSGANVFYFRTFDFSTLAVATGPALESTLVEIPSTATPGAYSLQVIANGIASDPVKVELVPVAPAISVNLEHDLEFGTVCGSPRFLTLWVFNVGNADLIVDSVAGIAGSTDFSVLPNPATPLTIAPGSEVEFTVEFSPTAPGPESATIRIVSNDPNQPNFDVTATGSLGNGSLEVVVPDSGSFGQVCVGSFRDLSLMLNNNEPCNLTVFSITSSSAEFLAPTVLTYPLVIGAGDSLEVPIRFAPSAIGPAFGQITITSDDPASPAIIDLTGSAPAPRLVTIFADSGKFGNVCLHSFADKPLGLANAGGCTLVVTGITSSSAEFVLPSVLVFPFTVAPGTAIDVPITFAPTKLGAATATITVFSNDPAGPHLVDVSGFTPSGHLSVYGSTYFGEVDCGIAQKTLSICNTGDCALFVSKVEFSRKRRNFSLLHNPFPAKLHPGSCLGVVIQYRASCEPECCELVIHSDDPHEPVKVLDVTAFTKCVKKCTCKSEPCCCGCEEEPRGDC